MAIVGVSVFLIAVLVAVLIGRAPWWCFRGT